MDQQNPVPPPAMPEMPPPTPPAVAWTPPVAIAPARSSQVTSLSKVSAVLLMILGVIVTLFGLLFVLGGAFVGSFGQMTEFGDLAGGIGTFVAVIGIVVVIIGVVEVLAGIGAWRGSEAGRIGGIIYGVLSGLFGLAALGGEGSSAGVWLVYIALNVFLIVALAVRWKEPATA
jgi:hypothetical protein